MRVLDDLIAELREVCSSFVDKRRGSNGSYAMADIGLSAFSVFFMQSPSFLAHQKMLEARRGRSNCASLFGMEKIPTDNHISRKALRSAAPSLPASQDRPPSITPGATSRRLRGLGISMARRLMRPVWPG